MQEHQRNTVATHGYADGVPVVERHHVVGQPDAGSRGSPGDDRCLTHMKMVNQALQLRPSRSLWGSLRRAPSVTKKSSHVRAIWARFHGGEPYSIAIARRIEIRAPDYADLAVRDSDAVLHRVSYSITVEGKIRFVTSLG